MYARDLEERTLTFGVSGKLIMNALVMYDRETDSLWSQFTGGAVQGPLSGSELEVLASSLTTWGAWRELHPDTLVLDQGGRRRDSYSGYYLSGSAGVLGESNGDDRLARKDLVFGVRLETGAKAYALDALERDAVVNDTIGGRPVVVAFDADTETGVAYAAEIDGRRLTFAAAEPGTGGGAVSDAETGTRWSVATGEAIEGELAGHRLESLPSFAVFWFAWSDYFPDGELYAPEG